MTFALGDGVRVADRPHAGHHRTPGYLKGRTGRIARVHAAFANPETRAYGEDGLPRLRLYLVEFAGSELWPSLPGDDDFATDRHKGLRVCADLFEHWLEPAA